MAGTPFDPEAEETEAAVSFWQYVCSSKPCTECHDPQPKFVTRYRFGLNRHVKAVKISIDQPIALHGKNYSPFSLLLKNLDSLFSDLRLIIINLPSLPSPSYDLILTL